MKHLNFESDFPANVSYLNTEYSVERVQGASVTYFSVTWIIDIQNLQSFRIDGSLYKR